MVLAIQDYHEKTADNEWLRKKYIMNVSDYLDPRCVRFINPTTRDVALRELVDLLFHSGKIEDKEAFYHAILEREKIVSTGIGMGVAIPHAKLKGFDDFFIAVGIVQGGGIEWNSLDKTPVRLIFMIGGPDDKHTKYLQILSKITHAIKDETLRKQLINIQSPKNFIQLFEKF